MVKGLYSSTLVDSLRKAGMNFLIPAMATSYDDDEGIGHQDPDSFWEPDDWELEIYAEDGIELSDEHPEAFDVYSQIHNLDELMLYFNCDAYEPEEFIDIPAWELFNLTLPQFKMIKPQFLNLMNCQEFNSVLNQPSDLSVEQRIRWATCCAVTDCHRWCSYRGKSQRDYCLHLSNLFEESQAIEYIRLYQDYLRFLPNALLMNQRRLDAGEQTFDYVVEPKPSHLRDLHDKAFRDFQVIETEKAIAEREQLDQMILDSSKNPGYTRFLYKDAQFMLVAPTCYADFEREGKVLSHCIASYADSFANFETYIYFLRRREQPDQPFFSIEVRPGDQGRWYSMDQCYTYNDTTDKDEDTRQFILNWCRRFRIKVNCEV